MYWNYFKYWKNKVVTFLIRHFIIRDKPDPWDYSIMSGSKRLNQIEKLFIMHNHMFIFTCMFILMKDELLSSFTEKMKLNFRKTMWCTSSNLRKNGDYKAYFEYIVKKTFVGIRTFISPLHWLAQSAAQTHIQNNLWLYYV